MLILLPFLAFLLVLFNTSSYKPNRKLLFREKIILSIIVWSILLSFITEATNIFNLINTPALTFSWIFADIALLIILFLKKPRRLDFSFKFSFKLDLEEKLMIAVIGIILAVTFFLAVAVAPNNPDAMSYQLARVMHWIQNGNIGFYATNITYQINNGALASYFQLHFIFLSGGDYFANLVQWFFYIGNIVVVSLVAKRFGLNAKGQLTSSFIFGTIPLAILQASTVHDPLLISFFLLSFIYFGLEFISSTRYICLIISAAALGLSLFTKQTAYFYAFPFFIWFFYLQIRKFGLKKTSLYFSVICATAIAINLPIYVRNFEFSGWPLFVLRNDYINTPLGLSSFTSTVIKNLGLNLSTPFPPVNQVIYNVLSSAMSFLKIPENGPAVNWANVNFYIPQTVAGEYNNIANTSHLLLFFLALIFMSAKKISSKLINAYTLCIASGFLFFSAIFKWQEAGSHLLFALFPISAPVISYAFVKWPKALRYCLIGLLMISSFYFLFFNQQARLISRRPIYTINRTGQYFQVRMELYKPYKQIRDFVIKGNYKNVGVIFSEYYSDTEYPLWVMLKDQKKDIRIENIEVTNQTARLGAGFKPDVVVFLGTQSAVLKKYIDKGIPVIGVQ